KEQLFEGILNDYPSDWTKEEIGLSYDGAHSVNAYVVTPESYTVTIAITGHVHGNEKYNPTGFMALLTLVSRNDLKYEFLDWIKRNVRWVIVPFVSPTAYINNERLTNGVNLNRNMDYNWELVASGKGTAPMSCVEN